MKVINSGLSKEQITGYKKYLKWFKKEETDVLLMVDEKLLSQKTGGLVNLINYKENVAFLCVDDMKYSINFFSDHKHYTLRLFIKNNKGLLYNEYAIDTWTLTMRGICVTLTP